MNLNIFFGYISKSTLFGFLPLDILAHLIVGTGVTIIGLKLKFKFSYVFLFLLFLCLAKEYYDSFVITSSAQEHLKDFIVTMIYPMILIIIRNITTSKTNETLGYYQ